jgi:hypothetical protein
MIPIAGNMANSKITGPVLVSAALIPDATKLHIRGLKSGRVMQDCPLTYVNICLTWYLYMKQRAQANMT